MGPGTWWTRRRSCLIGSGLAVAAVAIAHQAGLWSALDQFTLDRHFRYGSTIPASDELLVVAIDDVALEQVHRWPWPRRLHAELLEVLTELGAKAVAVDVVFADLQPPRLDLPDLQLHADLEADLGTAAGALTIHDDQELALALTDSAATHLAMVARLVPPGTSAQASPAPNPPFAEAQRALQADPTLTWPAFFAQRRPGEAFDVLTPERHRLLLAYRTARAAQACAAKLPGSPPGLTDALPAIVDATWPNDRLAPASAGVGFVTQTAREPNTVVRQVPLLAAYQSRLVPQLGVALAGGAGGLDLTTAAPTSAGWRWSVGARTDDVPVDEAGEVLINWHRPAIAGDWRTSFPVLPATRLLEVAELGRTILDNEKRHELLLAEVIDRALHDAPAELLAYQQLVESGATEPPSAEADAQRAAIQQRALDWLQYAHTLYEPMSAEQVAALTTEEQLERQDILRWHRALFDPAVEAERSTLRAELLRRRAALAAELRPLVAGKRCLVGYTAATEADMVATPICAQTPGVVVHAHVANMVLQGRYAQRASAPINLLVIVLAGAALALASATCGTGRALLALLVVAVGLVAGGAAVFATSAVHLATSSAALAALGAWGAGTAVRQATEERARRRLQRVLAQYTAPAVAARIAQRVDLSELAPQPAVVTCLLCDLRGFTPLSERLGPGETRALLNPYLERVSALVVAHGGLVNKFLGDGVLAFFNAPILPCPRHAERACACALAARQALAELNHTPAFAALPAPIRMGIAVTTGEVFVGNYGIETKFDYTCIGDVVNTCARLERANKTLGTSIIVDDRTHATAEASFLFAAVPALRLPGKQQTVSPYALLAAAATATDNQRAWAQHLQTALTAHQQRDWPTMTTALAAARKLDADTAPLAFHESCLATARTQPPPDNWDGSVVYV